MKLLRATLICLSVFLFPLHCLLYGQENYELKNLTFTGNHTFSSGRLEDEITMYGTSGLQKTFLRKKRFKNVNEYLQSDVRKIIRFYQREGFLFVEIPPPQVDANPEKKTVDVTFTIREGKPVLTDSVYFEIQRDSAVSQDDIQNIIDEARSSLVLQKGERFRDEDAEADQQSIIREFVNSGFPYMEIERELKINTAQHSVDIIWRIESGPPCVFGGIVVKGNGSIGLNIIMNQLAFKEGQPYSQKLIDKTQQQLYALGMFQIATVKAILTQRKEPVIPIVIQLQEAPKFLTKFGVGYGTEEKLRVSADTRQLGFLGGARQANLFLKHSSLEPYKAELQFTQPAFVTPRSILALNVFIRKENEPGYNVQRKGGSVSFIHPLARNLSGSVTYLLEEVAQDTTDLSQVETSAEEFEELYNKSSIILGLRHDSSSPLFYPDRGQLSIFSFKISGVGLNTAYDYLKILYDWRRYRSFAGDVIAFRLKIGAITPYNSNDFIPAEDRYYSGGSSSVRGWGRSLLGPLDDEGKPLGGNSLLEGSVEPRFPIYGAFRGVFFIDFGNVWSNSFTYKLNEIRYSWGVGLRYKTPIGPVRLDVAQPIFDEENRIQLHISVGHAF